MLLCKMGIMGLGIGDIYSAVLTERASFKQQLGMWAAVIFFFPPQVLGIESKASCMPGKCWNTKPPPALGSHAAVIYIRKVMLFSSLYF